MGKITRKKISEGSETRADSREKEAALPSLRSSRFAGQIFRVIFPNAGPVHRLNFSALMNMVLGGAILSCSMAHAHSESRKQTWIGRFQIFV